MRLQCDKARRLVYTYSITIIIYLERVMENIHGISLMVTEYRGKKNGGFTECIDLLENSCSLQENVCGMIPG